MRASDTRLRLAGAFIFATACGGGGVGGGGAGGILTSSATIPPGSVCTNGGTELQVGFDQNGDGILNADEVESSTPICNGSGMLITTTELPQFDPNCPYGGQQIDAGLDNGDGGETADDGTLGPGEIDTTTYVCHDPADPFRPLEIPTGAPGTNQILSEGGQSTSKQVVAGKTGNGGSGSSVVFEVFGTTGNIGVFTRGSADASFTAPKSPPSLGSKPLKVTGSATVAASDIDFSTCSFTPAVGLAVAVLETQLGDESLLYDPVDCTPFTGLHVAAGATLTFEANDGSAVYVTIPSGVYNEGTITTQKVATKRADLTIFASHFFNDEGGVINLSGLAASDSAGSVWLVTALRDGTIVNRGTITANGSHGAVASNGGIAGEVTLEAGGSIYNVGTISLIGGNGNAAASGGLGGVLLMRSHYSSIYTNGSITSQGGDGGDTGTGESAGSISLEAHGDIVSSSSISSLGGSHGTGYTGSTAAGSGGAIKLEAYGGNLVVVGDITSEGGEAFGDDTVAPAPAGGAGGAITLAAIERRELTMDDFLTPLQGIPNPAGDIILDANIVSRGGESNAQNGGAGGGITVRVHSPTMGGAGSILAYGVSDISSLGGTSNVGDGGAAGFVMVMSNLCFLVSPCDEETLPPSGSIVVEADLSSSGGDSSGMSGGAGNAILLINNPTHGAYQRSTIVSSGETVARGGAAVQSPGASGDIAMIGYAGVTVGGDVIVSGESGNNPRKGGEIRLESIVGDVTLNARARASGGSASVADKDGADGGMIDVVGNRVTINADITANGGHAGGGANRVGGHGGIVVAYGYSGTSVNTGACISVKGGKGTYRNGLDGLIDARNLAGVRVEDLQCK